MTNGMIHANVTLRENAIKETIWALQNIAASNQQVLQTFFEVQNLGDTPLDMIVDLSFKSI